MKSNLQPIVGACSVASGHGQLGLLACVVMVIVLLFAWRFPHHFLLCLGCLWIAFLCALLEIGIFFQELRVRLFERGILLDEVVDDGSGGDVGHKNFKDEQGA